jgi:hypothetical protein
MLPWRIGLSVCENVKALKMNIARRRTRPFLLSIFLANGNLLDDKFSGALI